MGLEVNAPECMQLILAREWPHHSGYAECNSLKTEPQTGGQMRGLGISFLEAKRTVECREWVAKTYQ